MSRLSAPFPWFGGKSRAAPLIWERLGNVPNYVEPFAGSLAVLLGRTHGPGTETVNDLDCYLANFWRAVKEQPASVAIHADWPVNEADLLARHKWLLQRDAFRAKMRTEPDYYDCLIAGWWVWGLCCWIGSGWCIQEAQQLPHLGSAGQGIIEWFERLSERLRRVRVACGDWARVLGESVTFKHGTTGILLDPPYSSELHDLKYSADTDCSAQVRAWAKENGEHPELRIALCGYGEEHDELLGAGWVREAWKQRKGYQVVDEDGGHGGEQERIWFSPHCLSCSLFDFDSQQV